MKACIIQPPYSRDVSFSDEYFEFKIKMLEECDSNVDIIVLPEYSDVPCATSNLEDTLYYHEKYIDTLLDKCIETAKRCSAIVFVNALSKAPEGWRNTTYAYNRNGELAGMYYKKHLPPLEAEEADEHHHITIEAVEDEHFITVEHDMTKAHYISFVAFVTSDRLQLVKLYPEGNAQTRLQLRGRGWLYICCNRHGLMKKKI